MICSCSFLFSRSSSARELWRATTACSFSSSSSERPIVLELWREGGREGEREGQGRKKGEEGGREGEKLLDYHHTYMYSMEIYSQVAE